MKKFGMVAILVLLPVIAGCSFKKNKGVIEGLNQPVIELSEEVPSEPPQVDPEDLEITGGFEYSERTPLGIPGNEILFDVTGDGNEDRCYCNMTGSGMVRVQCIVEDEVNSVKYVLDGYDYSYDIEGVTDGKLIVTEKGPYGYNHPLTKTYGTVKIKDNHLVFVADEDTLKKGLIVKARTRNDTGKGSEDYDTVTILRKGEKVYEGYGSVIHIRSSDNKQVVLDIEGCLVEPNPDGTINLQKEPLKEITVARDQSVVLKSQTMDGGVTIEIKYE